LEVEGIIIMSVRNKVSSQTETGDEMMEFVDGKRIVDAFINFNIGYSNKPDLYVETEDRVSSDDFKPVHSGEEDESQWIAENNGVFAGWLQSPPGISEDTRKSQRSHDIKHSEHGVQERYWAFTAGVMKEQNKRETASCLRVPTTDSTAYPIRVTKAQRIIDKYINGDLGSDCVSYWYNKHSQNGWNSINSSPEDYDGLVEPSEDIILVYKGSNWVPILESEQRRHPQFDRFTTYYCLQNVDRNTTWDIHLTKSEAEKSKEDISNSQGIDSEYEVQKMTFGDNTEN